MNKLSQNLWLNSNDSVFSNPTCELMSLSTNNVRTDVMEAEKKGVMLVKAFVTHRFIETSHECYSTLPKNKSNTLGTMYKVKVPAEKDKVVTIKAERDIFRRLLVVSDSRSVDLSGILKHESSPVPLAIAGTNHKLKIDQLTRASHFG